MSDVISLAVPVASALIAWFVGREVRDRAESLGLLQAPNERSSHVRATPSGGGVGIAIAGVLAGAILLGWGDTALVVLAASAAAALLGFLDDRYDLSARARFPLQALIVLAVVAALPPSVSFFGIPPLAVTGFVVFAGIWWFNLFNFMDGIDGLAASTAILAILGAASIVFLGGDDPTASGQWLWACSVAAACAGFLVLNWPPASIFMGDAGSNYIATAILAIALWGMAEGQVGASVWLVLLAFFIGDATYTLIVRFLTGQKWFAGHRLHGYQKLSRRFRSHRRATGAALAYGIAWLYPLALACHFFPDFALLFIPLAYLPVIAFCAAMGAGRIDAQPTAN